MTICFDRQRAEANLTTLKLFFLFISKSIHYFNKIIKFVKDKYDYARIYIGYNDILDKNKGYVIYMRYVQLAKSEKVTTFLNTHFK